MPLRLRLSALLHLVVALAASAAPWDDAAPAPTAPQGPDPNGWSPVPTTAPSLAVVELLMKRQTSEPDYVCGYVNGDPSNRVSCVNNARTCVFDTLLSAQACCLTTRIGASFSYTGCTFYTSCVPFASACNSACLSNTLIKKCSSADQYCYTYSYASYGIRNFGCTTRSYLSVVYLTPTDTGTRPITFRTPTLTGRTSTARTPSASSDSTSTASTSRSVDVILATSSSTPSSKSSKPIGPIIGGVIGGVAVLGLFTAVIAWIVIKKSKKSNDPAAAAPPVGYGGPPPNPQYMQQPGLGPQYPIGAVGVQQPYDMAQAPNPNYAYQQQFYSPNKAVGTPPPHSPTMPGSPAPAYGAFHNYPAPT